MIVLIQCIYAELIIGKPKEKPAEAGFIGLISN